MINRKIKLACKKKKDEGRGKKNKAVHFFLLQKKRKIMALRKR